MTKLALALLAGASFLSSDVSGIWTATAEARFPSGKVETHPMVFIFRQQDTLLTGSVGVDAAHQLPIANGRVVRDSLTFDCKWGNGTLLHFALGARGDEIQGQGRGDEKDAPKNPDENYTNVFYLTMKRASSR